MNSEERIVRGKHDDLTQRIIGVFYDVYNELGEDFLSLYIVSNAAGFESGGHEGWM
jgi:hypothetical protein